MVAVAVNRKDEQILREDGPRDLRPRRPVCHVLIVVAICALCELRIELAAEKLDAWQVHIARLTLLQNCEIKIDHLVVDPLAIFQRCHVFWSKRDRDGKLCFRLEDRILAPTRTASLQDCPTAERRAKSCLIHLLYHIIEYEYLLNYLLHSFK